MTISEFIRSTAESLERRRLALRMTEQAREALWLAREQADEPYRSRIDSLRAQIDALSIDMMMDARISQWGD